MKELEKPDSLVATLKTFEPFQDINEASIQWVVDHSTYRCYERGEHIFRDGEAVSEMRIIIDGEYTLYRNQNGSRRELGTWATGYIMGVLPFSRMEIAKADGIANRKSYTLDLPRACFSDLVVCSYPLVQNLVALMSTRIREFSQMQFQNEKLMSLGKLSAGLAHELNNPAGAMVRSAENLYKTLHHQPEKFKDVVVMRAEPEQVDQINGLLQELIEQGQNTELTTLQRSDRADEILDWLEDHDIKDADDLVDTFVDYGFNEDLLERFGEILNETSLSPTLNWIENMLDVETMMCEIRESANRISTLIKSMKSYSHMDQATESEATDIHEGLRSTLVMMKHKMKDKNISLEKEFGEDLPQICAMGGELNQVWTNIIDNAIDAMEQDGILKVRTYTEREMLCVEIIDNGAGIPEDIQTRVYDPFFTTKKMNEGTGMGLDIVQKIVNRHNGVLQLESEPGRTCFRVCLPV